MEHKQNKLSEFPTQVLLHEYRKNRICDTHFRFGKVIGVEKEWVPHIIIVDGKPFEDYYTLIKWNIYEEIPVTEISSRQAPVWDPNSDCVWYDDHLRIRFEGKQWEGSIKQLREELNTREHVNITGAKGYRKWLIDYRKNKNNKQKYCRK
jgi:hypothetical protein